MTKQVKWMAAQFAVLIGATAFLALHFNAPPAVLPPMQPTDDQRETRSPEFQLRNAGHLELAKKLAEANVAQKPLPNAIDYNRDILPILANNCFICHGADPEARKAKLRLDVRDLATKPARSGEVPIKPGKANESEVIRRIFAEDATERMPPATSNKSLTDAEKELIKRWIDEGAEYKAHWAFIKPVRPALPDVKDKSWVRSEIDYLVLAKLEAAGLKPSPRADRPTLIRRLSLDLRGLPPSLDEVDAVLSDKSPDWYEKLVDRMLASPRYGEKMALLWLDLARFGDTSGFHQDSTRQVWLWRDWVISAFNANMPFDQFTIEQLAGDLLPKPTIEQKIATGFNRHTRFNEEGGADPEEFVIRYNVDRASNLGQVWLGLTLGCAECHSHKYDPISQKEFYQLYAYFTGIKEPMVSMNHNQPLPPLLKVPSPEQSKKLESLQREEEAVKRQIARELALVKYKDPYEGTPLEAKPPPEGPFESQLVWERLERPNTKLPADVQAALKKERADRTVQEKQTLRDHYLRKVYYDTREIFDPLDKELEQITKQIKETEEAIPHTMVCEEMEQPRPAYVLTRGDFLQRGEKVGPAVPSVFPPMAEGQPNNRLGLARWLVSADHPLTARVTVNRLWAQMFGYGIVRSLGDFGSQGEFPSHPELLDWLAVELMSPSPLGGEGGVRGAWDIKATLRKIALSATYQQSSVFSGGAAAKVDPGNRLLSRAPRYRLTAEEIRDSTLAISGLLSSKIGGPSVMPYQPPDFFKGKYEGWTWILSQGEDQYRRGMYTFWRRTSLHPMFTIFDAPSREECVVARPRTNTPLQALVTLNDPTFVESARVFAQRILSEGSADLDGRITFAFRTALARTPTEAEKDVVKRHYQRQLALFQANRDAASKLVNVGLAPRLANLDVAEHAAWMGVANMLLNLDEVITRE